MENLFRYKGKVYVRPFVNKIIEVIVEKNKDGSFNVKATNNKVELTKEVSNELYSIPIEEAYKMQNKPTSKETKSKKFDLI